MIRNPLHLTALLLGVALSACGEARPPRGDLVLIIAQAPPATPSPHFEKLAASGIVFEGDLLRPGALDASPKTLLSELFTGQRAEQKGGALYEFRPALPKSARLAGYRVLGVTHQEQAIAELQLENGFDYGLFGATSTDEDAESIGATTISEGATEALTLLAADYRTLGVRRAPILFFGDLTQSESPAEFERLLDALSSELLVGVSDVTDATTPTTVLLLFLDPSSPIRAILAGPDLKAAHKSEGVDPRDIFPTIARRGQIPARALLKGVNVPSFLAGRNLLDGN